MAGHFSNTEEHEVLLVAVRPLRRDGDILRGDGIVMSIIDEFSCAVGDHSEPSKWHCEHKQCFVVVCSRCDEPYQLAGTAHFSSWTGADDYQVSAAECIVNHRPVPAFVPDTRNLTMVV